MLRSVLLVLDGIVDGMAAAETAASLAARRGADVTLLLTLDRAAVGEPEAVGLGGSSRFAHRERVIVERLSARLERAGRSAAGLCARAGVGATVARLEGDVRAALPGLAVGHDLVVLANGRRRLEDSDDIDVAFSLPVEEVVRAVPRPVLLADREPLAADDARPLLVAFDGGRAAATSLHLAALLGLAEGREAHVVTVGDDPEAARVTALRACGLLARHGARAAVAHGLDGGGLGPAGAVAAKVAELGPAAIAMGAFGERSLREWLFGSTTCELIGTAGPPIFLHA